ncbi:MAG: class I SAM-dependent rRNA methyltransferase, partial [Chlamydiales bacterium]|nr:class I SAM-dependent rRNA methyltransferase [Chlamydiales bacterium]
DQILQILIEKCKPLAIYEKSLSSARRQEGLSDTQGWVYGKYEEELIVKENGFLFQVSLEKGQKTGFFLDQREMRQAIGELSYGKKVLNCFSYSAGFSVYALANGAQKVVSIDCNRDALELAEKNITLNRLDPHLHTMVQADVFEFLRTTQEVYDLIILDPPAFAKKRKDQEAACAGYKEINRMAFELLKKAQAPLPLLLSCSCSHFIDEDLFQNILFQASIEADCQAKILSSHIQAKDHPIALTHPEGRYLKSRLVSI